MTCTRAACFAVVSSLLLAAVACDSHPPASVTGAMQADATREIERQQIDNIPPPSKNRYLAVRSLESWENPYLTVQPGMVSLHVLRADVNPNPQGAGGLMRPVNARRENLNLALDKLPDALSSIPADAWPYGRVVAVEEAHNTPAAGEPQVRRNLEATVRMLNDLGVVAYEWPNGTETR